jgi:hypothetical protein
MPARCLLQRLPGFLTLGLHCRSSDQGGSSQQLDLQTLRRHKCLDHHQLRQLDQLLQPPGSQMAGPNPSSRMPLQLRRPQLMHTRRSSRQPTALAGQVVQAASRGVLRRANLGVRAQLAAASGCMRCALGKACAGSAEAEGPFSRVGARWKCATWPRG